MPKKPVRPALERAVLCGLDRLEDGRSSGFRALVMTQSPANDWSASTPIAHALLAGGVERAETALAGDLEDDVGALRDLVERDLLALRLVDEVLRVRVQELDARASCP